MLTAKNILSASFIACVACASCGSSKHTRGSSKKLPGVWQVQPIVIDGKNNDWPAQYPDYDMKAAIGYAISNDKDNLYITVETGDRATQLKILKNGLVVWIDKTGEKEQTLSLNFPSAGPRDNNTATQESDRPEPQSVQQVQDPEQRRKYEMEDKVNAAFAKAQYFYLNGFRGCRGQFSLAAPDTCGIEVRAGIDDMNELVWEAKIPLKTFYYKQEVDHRDIGRALSVCFDIQGMKRPANQNNGYRGGGMRGGPGMGFGMGGMSSGMGGGGMRNGQRSHGDNTSEQLYKSTLTWKKFGIAYKEPK